MFDADVLIANGYFAAGNLVVVHGYRETDYSRWSPDAAGRKPFEVHFFPGAKKVLVLGRRAPLPRG